MQNEATVSDERSKTGSPMLAPTGVQGEIGGNGRRARVAGSALAGSTPASRSISYSEFLRRKSIVAAPLGFEPRDVRFARPLFDWQRDITRWACRRGRAALFEDCGLGKTAQQLAWAHEVRRQTAKPVLILTPLAVSAQTMCESIAMGIDNVIVASEASDVDGPDIVITNYQKLHRFDPSAFGGVVLDESSILKSLDGSTRKQLIDAFRHCPYRLAATATPAPNDFMELGNHAEFLGVMTLSEMLSTFFVHDGGETSKWRLKGHAESDFWKWLCSWAVNIRRPSDIGYSDDGYDLPELRVNEHVVHASHAMEGFLFALPASSLKERRDARRATLTERIEHASMLANMTGEQVLVWCNLNSESEGAASAIDGAVEVTGSDTDEKKEEALMGFISGAHRVLVTKPTIAGFGLNLQNCHREIFLGLSDSWEQYYQCVRRCWRFGQTKPVDVDIVISDLEGAVLANIKRKESDAARMASNMISHMSDLTRSTLTGSIRTQVEYTPSSPIQIPSWIQ